MTIARITLSCLVLAMPGLARGDGPAADVAELKTLDRWAGRWETSAKVEPGPDGAGGSTLHGEVTGDWVLGGRFLRQSWTVDGGKISGTTLMTYEPERGIYRNWTFNSFGIVAENEGRWDAGAKTMTWTRKGPGPTAVTKATFPDGETETWTITQTDNGRVVESISGKNTRRKP